MSSNMNHTPDQAHPLMGQAPKPGWKRFLPGRRSFAALAILIVGLAGGALAMRATRPPVEMAPTTPVAISALPTAGLVTIKGQVTDVYGKNFIIQDATGRTLVDAGRPASNGKLFDKDETLTVQGRVDNNTIRASFLVHADGHVDPVGRMGPLHGPGGPEGPDGHPPRPHWWRHLIGR